MALSPKDQERIIEEEKLRFKIRQDLRAQACAEHPRRGRWLWVLALVLLGWVLLHHSRFCGRGCMTGMACQHGMMMGASCARHGWMVPPADGQDEPAPPAPDAAAKSAAPKASAKE
jgi:hypothetical protein